MVRYKGYEVELGGQKYVFPALSLGSVEVLQDKITAVTSGGDMMKQIGNIIDIAHASLKRNYPEIKREEVAELIDISNLESIFINIMSTSGMIASSGSASVGEVDAKK